jgi:hypothetical protein
MIGHYPANADFAEGFRFITGAWREPLFKTYGSSTRRAELLHTVVSRKGDEFTTLDQHGKAHTGRIRNGQLPSLGTDERLMTREVLWAGDLPNGPFEQIRVLADAMTHHGWRNRPYLLLCDSVSEEGHAQCRLVHPAEAGLTKERHFTPGEDESYPGTRWGSVFVLDELIQVQAGADLPWEGWKDLPPAYSPKAGDFFLAMDLTLQAVAPPVISYAHLLLIAGDMSPQKIGDWMPDTISRTGCIGTSLSISTRCDLEEHIERAHARLQPDEIIVIAVPTPNNDVHLQVLSKSGIKLHDVDCPSDDLYGTDLEPGIWLGTGIAWYNAGDDGAEWEADFQPAIATDLDRHGLSAAELIAEWLEYAEQSLPDETLRAAITAIFPDRAQELLETDVATG